MEAPSHFVRRPPLPGKDPEISSVVQSAELWGSKRVGVGGCKWLLLRTGQRQAGSWHQLEDLLEAKLP